MEKTLKRPQLSRKAIARELAKFLRRDFANQMQAAIILRMHRSHINKFLNGREDWSMEKMISALEEIGYIIRFDIEAYED